MWCLEQRARPEGERGTGRCLAWLSGCAARRARGGVPRPHGRAAAGGGGGGRGPRRAPGGRRCAGGPCAAADARRVSAASLGLSACDRRLPVLLFVALAQRALQPQAECQVLLCAGRPHHGVPAALVASGRRSCVSRACWPCQARDASMRPAASPSGLQLAGMPVAAARAAPDHRFTGAQQWPTAKMRVVRSRQAGAGAGRWAASWAARRRCCATQRASARPRSRAFPIP